jgi:hypothetical protein
MPWFPYETAPSAISVLELDFVLLTHYDEDHYLGVDRLLGCDPQFSCKRFFCPFPPPAVVAKRKTDNPRLRQKLDNIQTSIDFPDYVIFGSNYELLPPAAGGQCAIRGIAPSSRTLTDMKEWRSTTDVTAANIMSCAITLRFGKCVAFFGGDVEEREWGQILRDMRRNECANMLQSNVALAPHHGGSGNPDDLWHCISRVSRSPEKSKSEERRRLRTLAIISCGGRRGSPALTTLDTIGNKNAAIHCTQLNYECVQHYSANKREPACAFKSVPPVPEGALHPQIIKSRYAKTAPTLFAQGARDYSVGSICVDLFKESAPRIFIHNGADAIPISSKPLGAHCLPFHI